MALQEKTAAESGCFFHIEQQHTFAAAREEVFDAITAGIDQWWIFRILEGGSTLRIEAKVGGLFVEENDAGDGRYWGRVEQIQRPEQIRLSGPLGMNTAVMSTFSFTLQEHEGQTMLRLEHRAFGDLDPEMGRRHDEGWNKLLGECLRRFVEQGAVINAQA